MVAVVAGAYSASAGSPGIQIYSPSVRQGTSLGVEALTVANVGTGTVGSLTVLNPSLSASTRYCYFVWDAVSQAQLLSTCPTMSLDPTKVLLPVVLAPGRSVAIQIITGGGSAFSIGSSVVMTLVSSNAAQATAGAVVTPA